MQKSDSKELKKQLKQPDNCIVDWVYAFYVNSENEVVWEDTKMFHEYEEEEQFRHLGILNKALTCGKDMFSVQVEQNEFFHDIEPDSLTPLREMVLEQYHSSPYYATLTHILYDVPVKASDGAVLEDSGLYDGYVFAVCPAKLSTPTLGFDDGKVTDLVRRWTIGAPVCGFLYPSFNEREQDNNEAALYSKKNEGMDLFHNIFEIQTETMDADTQKESWNTVLSEVGVTSEEVSIINEALLENDGAVGCDELKRIVEEAGVDAEKFEKVYESVLGENELLPDIIASAKVDVQTESAKIQVPAEHAAFIKMKKIDGIEYILIPADGVVTVNGTEIITKGINDGQGN